MHTLYMIVQGLAWDISIFTYVCVDISQTILEHHRPFRSYLWWQQLNYTCTCTLTTRRPFHSRWQWWWWSWRQRALWLSPPRVEGRPGQDGSETGPGRVLTHQQTLHMERIKHQTIRDRVYCRISFKRGQMHSGKIYFKKEQIQIQGTNLHITL